MRENLRDVKTKTELGFDIRHKYLQIGFWNVSGIRKKTPQFWEYIKEYDFIGFVETWLEKQDLEKISQTLPNEFNWKSVPARRDHKKGRAKGGIITGVKEHIHEEETEYIETEHAQERRIEVDGKSIRILTVYSTDGDDVWEVMKSNFKESGDAIILGGDFNARIGEKGGRKSKDKKINKVGKEFVRILEEKHWSVLNGSIEGDEDGDFTFTGKCGSSVIDYAVANCMALEDVKHFEVEKRTESDHRPIKIILNVKTKEKEDFDEEYKKVIEGVKKL